MYDEPACPVCGKKQPFQGDDYLKTWRWQCPDHGRVEMLLTNPPLCVVCKKRCAQVEVVPAKEKP